MKVTFCLSVAALSIAMQAFVGGVLGDLAQSFETAYTYYYDLDLQMVVGFTVELRFLLKNRKDPSFCTLVICNPVPTEGSRSSVTLTIDFASECTYKNQGYKPDARPFECKSPQDCSNVAKFFLDNQIDLRFVANGAIYLPMYNPTYTLNVKRTYIDIGGYQLVFQRANKPRFTSPAPVDFYDNYASSMAPGYFDFNDYELKILATSTTHKSSYSFIYCSSVSSSYGWTWETDASGNEYKSYFVLFLINEGTPCTDKNGGETLACDNPKNCSNVQAFFRNHKIDAKVTQSSNTTRPAYFVPYTGTLIKLISKNNYQVEFYESRKPIAFTSPAPLPDFGGDVFGDSIDFYKYASWMMPKDFIFRDFELKLLATNTANSSFSSLISCFPVSSGYSWAWDTTPENGDKSYFVIFLMDEGTTCTKQDGEVALACDSPENCSNVRGFFTNHKIDVKILKPNVSAPYTGTLIKLISNKNYQVEFYNSGEPRTFASPDPMPDIGGGVCGGPVDFYDDYVSWVIPEYFIFNDFELKLLATNTADESLYSFISCSSISSGYSWTWETDASGNVYKSYFVFFTIFDGWTKCADRNGEVALTCNSPENCSNMEAFFSNHTIDVKVTHQEEENLGSAYYSPIVGTLIKLTSANNFKVEFYQSEKPTFAFPAPKSDFGNNVFGDPVGFFDDYTRQKAPDYFTFTNNYELKVLATSSENNSYTLISCSPVSSSYGATWNESYSYYVVFVIDALWTTCIDQNGGIVTLDCDSACNCSNVQEFFGSHKINVKVALPNEANTSPPYYFVPSEGTLIKLVNTNKYQVEFDNLGALTTFTPLSDPNIWGDVCGGPVDFYDELVSSKNPEYFIFNDFELKLLATNTADESLYSLISCSPIASGYSWTWETDASGNVYKAYFVLFTIFDGWTTCTDQDGRAALGCAWPGNCYNIQDYFSNHKIDIKVTHQNEASGPTFFVPDTGTPIKLTSADKFKLQVYESGKSTFTSSSLRSEFGNDAFGHPVEFYDDYVMWKNPEYFTLNELELKLLATNTGNVSSYSLISCNPVSSEYNLTWETDASGNLYKSHCVTFIIDTYWATCTDQNGDLVNLACDGNCDSDNAQEFRRHKIDVKVANPQETNGRLNYYVPYEGTLIKLVSRVLTTIYFEVEFYQSVE